MTQPRQRTVDDIAAPYGNFLTPMPRRGPGVCDICRRGVEGSYSRCFKCNMEAPRVGVGGADAVAAIALAPADNQLAYELVNYKREATSTTTRDRFTVGLAAVLWKWLALHEGCLAQAAGAAGFDLVTTVPSSSSGRQGPHPLVRVVSGIVVGTETRYRDLLCPGTAAMGQRDYRADRYTPKGALTGENILLIDDTFTSGAHMHAAAHALKSAGGGRIGGLAIGRWYHKDDHRNARVEAQRSQSHWDWATCMLDEK